MWMLLLVAYSQRDPNAYFLQKHIKDSFSRNVSDTMSLGDVFSWAHKALLRNLFGEFSGERCSLCQLFLQFYSSIIIKFCSACFFFILKDNISVQRRFLFSSLMYHLDSFAQISIPPLKVQIINLNLSQRMQQRKAILERFMVYSVSHLEESFKKSCLGESSVAQS